VSRETMTNKRARLRDLHARGLSTRAIAAELGVHQSTVSKWAKQEGLTFDRAQVAKAVAARQVDLAAKRQELAGRMLLAVEAMFDKLDEPYLVYSFGGRDNTYSEHLLESPPIEVSRHVITMAGIVFDKLTRIVEREPNTEGAVSLVQSLEAGLLAAADVLRSPPTDTTTVESV